MVQVATDARKSTIVRLYSAPRQVRAAFWLLDRFSPGVAARWAERIWFTLPPARAHVTPTPAVRRTPFTLDVEGHAVVGEVWGDRGDPIYAMHGWAGHRGQLHGFVAPLVARGYRVVTFDTPSHGESAPGAFGPRSASIPEFVAALNAVAAEYGPPHGLIAHSLGANAAACALCDGLSAKRVVLLAPMASPMSFAHQFAKVLGLGPRTFTRLVTRVERRIGAPMHHFDAPAFGRAIAMPPALVIHDRDDVSTPVSDGAAIAAGWPAARLRVTTGLGHRRMLSDPDVIEEAARFLAG